MKRIVHNEEKWIFPFVEYSCNKTDKKLPLIIQLHGAGERGNGKEELSNVDVHGFSKHLKDTEYDCIVVMPQCPKESFWAARVESILNFIEQLKGEFNIDEKKIYLTGFVRWTAERLFHPMSTGRVLSFRDLINILTITVCSLSERRR